MFFHHETAIQFLTPDEIEEVMLLLQPGEDEPVASPNSGSDEGSNHGSGLTDSGSMDQDRKRKRNRESARRSRWRRKRYLEDLTSDADRLSNQNRELKNRLGLVANRCNVVRRENEQLRSESVALWAKLSDLRRIFTTIHAITN